MSNFTTFFNNMAKMDLEHQDLDALSNLAQLVVKDDLGSDSKSLITAWAEKNDIYYDFSFALRPDYLVGTPDDKQVKMRVTFNDGDWYAYMVMDCENGECESWGEKEFKREELEDKAMPVKFMLEEIRKQYNAKLEQENARTDDDIKIAVKAKKKMIKHIEAINAIAKEMGVKLYVDRNLDGADCIYVVPDTFTMEESDQDEVALDIIPDIDLEVHGFDSNYDHFTRIIK